MPNRTRPTWLLLAAGSILLAVPALAWSGESPAAGAACDSLQPDRTIRFQGRDLRDTPALGPAPLRLLNAQLSRGECADAAVIDISQRIATSPDDPGLAFLEARADALAGRRMLAERRVDALLERVPGMQPAQVLKASLLLDREKRADARSWLEKAAAAQPDDLRPAFLRLRVDALDEPKGEGVRMLGKALSDASLPPDLREDAQATILYLSALDLDRKEAAMREGLGFQSQTPRWDKATALARLLAEESGKPEQARELAQGVLDDPAAPMEAHRQAGMLVAETWLMDAAKIDPEPSPRNRALIDKARAAVEGDMVPVAGRIRSYHDLSHLRPFVADVHDADERGPDGLTLLCRGVQLLEASKVRRALEAGAKVDGECSGSTPLAYLVRQGPGMFNLKQDILRMLLDAGADPDPRLYPGSSYTAMSFCAEGLKGCPEALLPMLREAADARSGAGSVTP